MPRVVLVHETGGIERLRVEEHLPEAPREGEIGVVFETIGLNRAECAIRGGYYVQRPEMPTRLGFEGAGRVRAIGENVTGFAVGDYVSFIPGSTISRYGTYADEAVMPAALAVKTPESIAPEIAASMWMAYLTAYGGLVEAGAMRAGETVLITAASSSVGLAALQVCRKLGAVPIATTRGPEKAARLREAGAEHVVVTNETPVDEAVMVLTAKQGASLIFDPVSGEGVEALGRAAAFNGRIILYGGLGGNFAPYPFGPGLMKGLTLRAFYLLELTHKPDWFARGKQFVLDDIAYETLKPTIDRVFDLSDVAAAHNYLDSGERFGKVLMKT